MQALAKFGKLVLPFLAGKLGSGDKATAIVRFVRLVYTGSAATIIFAWYTGWRNERIAPGDRRFPFPGVTKLNKRYPASRADRDGESINDGPAKAPSSGGVMNSKGPSRTRGATQHERFNATRYQNRLHIAKQIFGSFRLRFTSGYRDPQRNAAANGAAQSLHMDGLAFDGVGAVSDMRRGYEWALNRTDLFQEVLLHDAGSGLHLHLAFWPDAGLTVAAPGQKLPQPISGARVN